MCIKYRSNAKSYCVGSSYEGSCIYMMVIWFRQCFNVLIIRERIVKYNVCVDELYQWHVRSRPDTFTVTQPNVLTEVLKTVLISQMTKANSMWGFIWSRVLLLLLLQRPFSWVRALFEDRCEKPQFFIRVLSRATFSLLWSFADFWLGGITAVEGAKYVLLFIWKMD